jgi:hypothetical protein
LIALWEKLAQVAPPMSDENESKAGERDGGEEHDSDSELASEREPAPAASKKVGGKPRARAMRREAAAAAEKGASVPASRVSLFVVLALAAGGAAGWFGHIAQAKAALKADSAAPAGSSSSGVPAGPCGAWQQKICGGAGGEQSSACLQAKGAAELLTPATCEVALAAVPATLTKLKAARASCDKLVSKLCTDLPPGSQACAMVKERTPSFPAQRCDEMLKHYDEVIGQLRQIDQQGGMQMGGPGGPRGPGGPSGPGGPGPVMPPH